MATLTQIRERIQATLAAVPGVGIVHSYQRFADHKKDMKAFYVSGDQLNGWFIRHKSRQTRSVSVGRQSITHGWEIHGFMALVDATESETVFDNLVEDICTAFIADENLGGLVDTTTVNDLIGLQIANKEPVMFCGILCHSVKATLNSRHFE